VPKPADEKTRDLSWPERLVLTPLIILIVFLGVFPKPALDRIDPSVTQLVTHVEKATGHDQASVAVKRTAALEGQP
jgi:NADH-quinone oxidoreductase subunit M